MLNPIFLKKIYSTQFKQDLLPNYVEKNRDKLCKKSNVLEKCYSLFQNSRSLPLKIHLSFPKMFCAGIVPVNADAIHHFEFDFIKSQPLIKNEKFSSLKS